MSRNHRRQFLLSSAALLLAPRARAQSRPPRIGILTYAPGPFTEQYVQAFREGMQERGYADGRDVLIERQFGQISRETTDRLAAELIERKPAVIVAQGYAIRAVAARTKTLPIVCAYSGDLADAGLVKSLAQPGGNVTGVQLLSLELAGKRIELLKELMPGLRRIAVIADPGHAGEHRERDVSLKAAERLGMQVTYHPAKNFAEIDSGLAAARAAGAEALVLFPDTITNNRTAHTAAFALQNKLATVAGWANYVDAGQLISYGPNLRESWKRLAYYVDRILKGASPASLPVEMPAVLELAINLGTARALGITVPPTILLRADRVIE